VETCEIAPRFGHQGGQNQPRPVSHRIRDSARSHHPCAEVR
jgi:hypothetical protein